MDNREIDPATLHLQAGEAPKVCPSCGADTMAPDDVWLHVYAAGVEVRRGIRWRCESCGQVLSTLVAPRRDFRTPGQP